MKQALYGTSSEQVHIVAPRRGAWIETPLPIFNLHRPTGRTPQGCVD